MVYIIFGIMVIVPYLLILACIVAIIFALVMLFQKHKK